MRLQLRWLFFGRRRGKAVRAALEPVWLQLWWLPFLRSAPWQGRAAPEPVWLQLWWLSFLWSSPWQGCACGAIACVAAAVVAVVPVVGAVASWCTRRRRRSLRSAWRPWRCLRCGCVDGFVDGRVVIGSIDVVAIGFLLPASLVPSFANHYSVVDLRRCCRGCVHHVRSAVGVVVIGIGGGVGGGIVAAYCS